LARFAGTFANAGDTVGITLRVEGNTLMASISEGGGTRNEMPCIPLTGDRFAWARGVLGFDVEPDGSVRKGHFQHKMFIKRVEPSQP
jgi:hypothetical protein